MVLPTALLYTVFIVLTHVPSITISLRLLSWKDIRLCCTPPPHTPFASVEMMMWFLSLSSFTWWITFIDLHVWTIPISLEWSQLGCGGWSFGCALEFSLLIVYWELWHLCSSRRLLCRVFFCCILVGLGIGMMEAFLPLLFYGLIWWVSVLVLL